MACKKVKTNRSKYGVKVSKAATAAASKAAGVPVKPKRKKKGGGAGSGPAKFGVEGLISSTDEPSTVVNKNNPVWPKR